MLSYFFALIWLLSGDQFSIDLPKQTLRSVALVEEVIDGDTIVVNINGKQETVRLLGIDTPEMARFNKEAQCYANSAKELVNHLLKNNYVLLLSDADNRDRDDYARQLRYVIRIKDGKLLNINKLLVSWGYARTMWEFPISEKDNFFALEAKSRNDNIGIWKNCPVSKKIVFYGKIALKEK